MSRRERILILEDEAITALDLEQTLSLLGFEVGRIVASGTEAIAEAKTGCYDLILSDIVVQGPVDGIDAAKEILRTIEIPVVFLTAYGDLQTLSRARDARPYGYLIKPFHAEALRATVETALLRADLERRLRIREAELEGLSASLMSIREDERKRLAREIHDGLGQSLTLLRLDLSWIRDHPDMSREEMIRRHEDVVKVVDAAGSEVRRIVAGLRPTVLDELEVTAALDWACRDFARRTDLTVRFAADLPPSAGAAIDRELGTALFRILQEALTNVARHAQARTVDVSLAEAEGLLVLAVLDDGIGLQSNDGHAAGCHGLVGIRERAHIWGGTLSVRCPDSGSGTLVHVRIPWNPQPGGTSS